MNATTVSVKPLKRKISILEAEKKAIKSFTLNLIKKDKSQMPPSIEEAYSGFKMSPSKFKNLFKEVNGDSYYSFFLKNRLAFAAGMLEKGKRLKEVSDLLGYSQPIKFLIVFKKYYGTTSKKYKEEHKKVVKA